MKKDKTFHYTKPEMVKDLIKQVSQKLKQLKVKLYI